MGYTRGDLFKSSSLMMLKYVNVGNVYGLYMTKEFYIFFSCIYL